LSGFDQLGQAEFFARFLRELLSRATQCRQHLDRNLFAIAFQFHSPEIQRMKTIARRAISPR
jgi:hypothetical protein